MGDWAHGSARRASRRSDGLGGSSAHSRAKRLVDDELTLLPGLQKISIRFDGGPWLAPPGLARGADDFGDQFGVLLVR